MTISLKLISHNLNRYSRKFLKKINLKYIVMCENLSISGINTAGYARQRNENTCIRYQMFNEKYFERVIHHEVFHIINDQHKEFLIKEIGIKFNPIKILNTLTMFNMYRKIRVRILITETNGFFTEYSKSTASEDMAEVYSHIIYLSPTRIKSKIRSLDVILDKKI